MKHKLFYLTAMVLISAAAMAQVVDVNGYDASRKSGYSQLIKIYQNCENNIASITLSPSSVKLVSGQTQRISVETNTGVMGTYTWTSSDEAVATISTNGTVTAIKNGTATITCTEQGGATATCAVTVCTYLETLNFTEASILPPRVIDPTKKWTGLVITATGDSVYGYLGKTTLKIYSEGLYEDASGLTGASDGAIISMPTYVYGIASEDYPQLGISDTLWTFIFEKFHTSDLVEGGGIAPSTVDKDYYWTHVNKAFDAINDEDLETMYAEADSMSNAFNDTRIWTVAYDDEAGYYFNTWIPAGLLTKMSGVTLSGQGSSPYMYGISGGTAELQEVLGDNGWGVYYEEDAEGFMTITSTGLELGKSFKRKMGSFNYAAPARRGTDMTISAEDIKNNNWAGKGYTILNKPFVTDDLYSSHKPATVMPEIRKSLAPQRETSTTEKSHTITLYAEGCEEYVQTTCGDNTEMVIVAVPNANYQFLCWSDGNTSNPRLVTVTGDATYTAQFDKTRSGQCGENLYWSYNNGKLTISGFGAMYEFSRQPWELFCDSITSLALSSEMTTISDYAFANCTKLSEVTLGAALTNIGEYAFKGCRYLYTVNSYAINPPVAETNSFANYNVYLNVPCDNLKSYQLDAVFGSFKYIQCMGAEPTTAATDVKVEPSTNEAAFTWPTNDNASTYSITITKNGEVFCTLIFNANGQLTGIAFAPGRDGAHNAPAAILTANGFRFTVTGLNEGTHYAYSLDVKNASGKEIKSYTGEFNTKGGTTALEETVSGNDQGGAAKFVKDGILYILRDGKIYNAQGLSIGEGDSR